MSLISQDSDDDFIDQLYNNELRDNTETHNSQGVVNTNIETDITSQDGKTSPENISSKYIFNKFPRRY